MVEVGEGRGVSDWEGTGESWGVVGCDCGEFGD